MFRKGANYHANITYVWVFLDNLHQVKGNFCVCVSVFRSLNTRPLKIPYCLRGFSPSVVCFVSVQRHHIMFLAMCLCVYQCDMESNTLQMHFQGSGTEPLSKTRVTFQTEVLGEAFRCFTPLNGLRSLQHTSLNRATSLPPELLPRH